MPDPSFEPPPALAISDLTFGFGTEPLWRGLCLQIEQGGIHGLFGNNGSGKSTLFNVISGFRRPWSGTLRYFGMEPARHDAWDICRMGRGVTRTFQVPALVEELSVEENMMLANPSPRESVWSAATRLLPDPAEHLHAREELIAEFDLAPVRAVPLGETSYGIRRLTASVVAILSCAGLVLLDEPFANLSDDNVERLKSRIRREAEERKRSFLVIEHTPRPLADLVDALHLLSDQIVTITERDCMEAAMERFAVGLEIR